MIKFGTSGWRGIIADDFTFDNVRIVSQAISEYVKNQWKVDLSLRQASSGNCTTNDKAVKTLSTVHCSLPTVIIGYDTRFLSEKFAAATAEVLAGNGIEVLLCKRDTPTPVIAYEIIRQKLGGGVNFTASHNPFQYNGLKFSPQWGGPALPETTKAIEERCKTLKIEEVKKIYYKDAAASGIVKEIDPKPQYFKRIKELVDFNAIKKAKLKIAVDLLFGTGIGYLDEMLENAGVKTDIYNNYRDVSFGKSGSPEPNEGNLKDLVSVVKKESCSLGLSTDGDADRFGIIDSDGTFINPNQVIAILLYHLVKTRKWKGIVARSVMTTHLIDRLCRHFNLELKETPVGFKYIGEIMVNNPDEFIIGGEESGGLTIRGHVPEKDGVLACLLMAEVSAMHKKTLKQILKDIEKLVGPVYSTRVNFHLDFKQIENFKNKLKQELPKQIGALEVKETVTLDGYKFILSDGSWIGMRFSGTEPVVRLYAEAESMLKLNKLVISGKKYIQGK
jgi:phosphoglucomutase